MQGGGGRAGRALRTVIAGAPTFCAETVRCDHKIFQRLHRRAAAVPCTLPKHAARSNKIRGARCVAPRGPARRGVKTVDS